MNSRRTFLKVAIAGIASFFVFIWNKLTLNHLQTSSAKETIFPFNKNKRVNFLGNYIVITESNSTTAYSAHCTHLGCKIDKFENDQFICPCHGSRYDLKGNVLKGPAYKNLRIVSSTLSEDGNSITIKG